jgi:hypothetical protein
MWAEFCSYLDGLPGSIFVFGEPWSFSSGERYAFTLNLEKQKSGKQLKKKAWTLVGTKTW